MISISDISKFLRKHPRLDLFLYIIRYKLKSSQLSKDMLEAEKNPMVVHYRHNGNLNSDLILYVIRTDERNIKGGFCWHLRLTLLHMAYAEKMHFVPVVKWDKRILYNENKPIHGVEDCFLYFFENTFPADQIDQSDLVVYSKVWDVNPFFSFPGYYVNDSELTLLADMIKKYLRFNNYGKAEIGVKAEKIVEGRRVLGVHIRGTDFKKNYNAHPKMVTLDEYLYNVEQVLNSGNYDFVFLATDEEKTLDIFREKVGIKLLYHEVLRSKGGEALHTSTYSLRENHRYNLCREILMDLFTLGRCDGLIAGLSNVSIIARALKKSRGEKYMDEIILDKGINRNLRKF